MRPAIKTTGRCVDSVDSRESIEVQCILKVRLLQLFTIGGGVATAGYYLLTRRLPRSSPTRTKKVPIPIAERPRAGCGGDGSRGDREFFSGHQNEPRDPIRPLFVFSARVVPGNMTCELMYSQRRKRRNDRGVIPHDVCGIPVCRHTGDV